MAERKYASDYRLETYVSPSGKQQQRRVYQGAYYEFCQEPGVIRRLRRTLLASGAGMIGLLMPILFTNNDFGRTAYVILPVAAAFVPLYLLLAAARRLGFSETPFIREHRDKTDLRLRRALAILPVFLGIGCAGCAVHLFLKDWRGVELVSAAGLLGAWLISLVLLPQRRKAETAQVNKP